MSSKLSLLALVLICLQCSSPKQLLQLDEPLVFSFPNTSIRALKALSAQEVHIAGSEGVYAYTKNAGKKWHVDTIKVDGKKLHFRGIEVTTQGVFLMSIGSPAYLVHIPKGKKDWQIIYQEAHEKAFYDAIQIKGNLGVMMGDPTDECLSVVISKDAGKTWQKLSCDQLPKIQEGVAAFAASNSNISIQDNNIWLVTGGQQALVYHSADAATSWQSYATPIAQGQEMTGIFACDFKDSQTGIIVGGNWNEKAAHHGALAMTVDGGKTWSVPLSLSPIGFSSDVAFIPNTPNGIIAASSSHFSRSLDAGLSWQSISSLRPYTFQIINEHLIWAAGQEFVGAIGY